ncbi:MAG: crotonase/enoyl-CoA hydratase family protein [Alphaproteobacteria bacterium]|nr:MAG: crotonase/enoyl-CoA hydratase family protein [Alphaproteobacteria bacterium]
MSDTHVSVERREGVQILRLTRPEKKNALTDAMYNALADAMVAAEADDAIGAHLFASFQGVFTAGNDIADFLAQATGGGPQGLRGVMRFLEAQAQAEKPMVAAVDGLAIGIGTTLMFQCDMAFASPEAYFKAPFIDLGLVPENASSLLAPRIMGHARAFELLCLGEGFSAERALQAGFVNAVVPSAELDAHAFGVAARLAAKPREAMKLSRALLRGAPDERLAVMRREGALFAERLQSEEARAAFMAFMSRKAG